MKTVTQIDLQELLQIISYSIEKEKIYAIYSSEVKGVNIKSKIKYYDLRTDLNKGTSFKKEDNLNYCIRRINDIDYINNREYICCDNFTYNYSLLTIASATVEFTFKFINNSFYLQHDDKSYYLIVDDLKLEFNLTKEELSKDIKKRYIWMDNDYIYPNTRGSHDFGIPKFNGTTYPCRFVDTISRLREIYLKDKSIDIIDKYTKKIESNEKESMDLLESLLIKHQKESELAIYSGNVIVKVNLQSKDKDIFLCIFDYDSNQLKLWNKNYSTYITLYDLFVNIHYHPKSNKEQYWLSNYFSAISYRYGRDVSFQFNGNMYLHIWDINDEDYNNMLNLKIHPSHRELLKGAYPNNLYTEDIEDYSLDPEIERAIDNMLEK